MDIVITKMQLCDLEKLKENLTTDFDNFWTFSMLKQELENKQNLNSHYFVAKSNYEIVGFAGILTIIDEINIMNIVVKKSMRHLGIGSSLLKHIISYAKQTPSITSITLEVNQTNTPAISLYQKYGFKQVGLRPQYYHNTYNALLMTLYF